MANWKGTDWIGKVKGTPTIEPIQADYLPAHNLYPCVSGIDVAFYRKCGKQQIYRGLSESAGVDAIEAFERDKKIWQYLASHGVVEPIQVGHDAFLQPFEGVQVSSVSLYNRRQNAKSLCLGIFEEVATFEDYGYILSLLTLASFGVSQIKGTGKVTIIDASTAIAGGDVQVCLTALCSCILELFCDTSRESLPLEISEKHLKKYRSSVPTGIYRYLESLVSARYSSVRAAYDALRLVSWEYATPPWKKIKLNRKHKIALASIGLTVVCATIDHVWKLRPKPTPITAVAIEEVEKKEADAKKLTIPVLRHKIFVERSCVGCDLSGWQFLEEDLSGVDLSRANLTDARIVSSSVEGINLSEATLDNAYLEDLNLKEASISGASIKGTKFIEVYLNGTNASHVDFTEMYEVYPADSFSIMFNGVNFDYANLDDMTWAHSVDSVDHSIETINTEYSFRYASMKGFHYEKGNLSGSDFTGADLSGAYLDKTRLTHTIFDDANLSASNLMYTSLHHARAHRASFQGANLRWAFVGRASFNGSSFRNARLSFVLGAHSADVQDVDFTNSSTWFTPEW